MSQHSFIRRIAKLEAAHAAERRPLSCEDAEKMNAALAEIFFDALAYVEANPSKEIVGSNWIDELAKIRTVPSR
ncbi:hypothetical protein [Bosea thiooxidans]|uniref:hypothetical protein n=1 Tax=Bosea thiooxidans TaxID=53254 RepID=UPI000AA0F5C4|nr:hypothetical protein [Bosea thiooxidans]